MGDSAWRPCADRRFAANPISTSPHPCLAIAFMALAIAKPGTAIMAAPYCRWPAARTLRVACSWTRARTSRTPDCAQAPTAPLSALSHVEHSALPMHRRDRAPSGKLLKFQKVTWCFTPGTNSCPSACIGSAEVIGLAATSALCTAPSRPLPCGHSSHPSRWLFFPRHTPDQTRQTPCAALPRITD